MSIGKKAKAAKKAARVNVSNTAKPSKKTPVVLNEKKASSPASSFNGVSVYSNPFWNIWDAGDVYKVRIPAPGISKKNIKVKVNGNVLTIGSAKESKSESAKKNYVIKEYSYNSWNRSIALPKPVKQEDIRLRYKDGMLKIDLHKAKVK